MSRQSLFAPVGVACAALCALALGVATAVGVGASPSDSPPPSAADAPADPAVAAEFFETTIRPILAEHCYQCHSAEAEKLKGGLRLDSLEGLLKGGERGPAIVPGDAAHSRLVEAVGYENPDLQMPPKSRLSAQQIADLTKWVQMGAPWPADASVATDGGNPAAVEAFDLWGRRDSHWAWHPVRPQEPPAVKDAAWPRGPVDHFILARLEGNGLAPAPPADRRALIRRVAFALTGLPPTAEEVEAFVGDPSPDAYEKVVDRLLASPHFGERWARHWMDLVRYSDTLGNEADLPIPNSWRYRDYLVRAFNADLPYDQLVIEHVAGDLLPEPRLNAAEGFNESVIGTGFFWMGEGKRSPVDLRVAQAEMFDNRLDVLCKTFMGMTVSCARCHDHKFDAISAGDYYGLYGYLKSSRYTQAMVNKAAVDAKAAELADVRTRVREVGGAALAERAAAVSRYLMASAGLPGTDVAGLDAAATERWAGATSEAADVSHPLYPWQRMAELGPGATAEAAVARWREVRGELTARAEADAKARFREGDVELTDFAGPDGYADRDAGWFVEDQSFGAAPLRPGDFLLGTDANRPILTFVRGGGWAHSGYLSRRLQGTLRSATFSVSRRYLHVLAAGRASRVNVVVDHFVMIQSPLYGDLRRILDSDGPQWLTFDLGMWQGREAYVEFADTTTQDLHDQGAPTGCGPEGYVAVGRALLSDQGAPAAPVEPLAGLALFGEGESEVDSLTALADRYQRVISDSLAAFREGKLVDKPDADARAALLAWLVERGLLDGPAVPEVEALFAQFRQAESQIPEPVRVAAMTEGTPADEYVFIRGNPKEAGPVVPRRMLQAVAGPAETQPPVPAGCSGRLQLARQIASADNPLTARVMVNRVWHHLFGRGIVASTDNFGALGERPTHPELLDHLAARFVQDGWSLKRLVRELVLSNAFQMSSQGTADADSVDPSNRLLHRMPVRRLEAEAVRDAVLAVSGRLDRAAMYGPGVEVYLTPYMDNYADSYGRPKVSGPLDGDGRRSIYQIVRRNFLNPMLLAFDSPPPLNTAGRRSVSNVPAQALILMNDPFVAQQAGLWAKRVLVLGDLDSDGRIRRMYVEAFARPPTDEELSAARRFLDRHGEALGVPADQRAADERLWSDFAHVLMNLKEFIFLN